ncbi:MAG TPA: hypothetical protein VFD53_08190, partial [Ilumatobacter sp.]|nr:hypothetical protein [Ilumatobacter sp.]
MGLVALVATAALIAASCGGEDDDDATGTAETAEATATGEESIPAESSAPADTSAPAEPTAESTAGSTPAEVTGGGEDVRPLVIARDMDINSLDISRSYCDTCQIFNTAVYETLITVDPADPNTLEPRLATAWEGN